MCTYIPYLCYAYSRNCYLRPPLGAAKTSLKQQVVCETRVAKTCPCKINTSSPQIGSGRHFQQSHLCCSKFTQRVVPSLHKPTTRSCVLYSGPHTQVHVDVHGSVHATSGSRWSHSAGHWSPQKLFCTKSSMHRILAIKTRWSLTTKFVNSSFGCIWSPIKLLKK